MDTVRTIGENENQDTNILTSSIVNHHKPSFREKIIFYYSKYMMIVGILGNALFYLQAFKIFSQKSAQDVSLEGFLMSLLSVMSWLIYGLLMKDKVLFVVNVIATLGASLTVFAILYVSYL